MKRCPQCNHIATDDLLAFCRTDGARLVQDSDSLSDRKTVALLPDAPPSVMDESLNARAASTRLMDSPKATSPTIKLIGRKKLQMGVTVIAALIVLTLAGSAYYSLSRKSDAAIYSLAVLPFINVNEDQQLEYLSDGITEMLICNLSQLPKLNVKARSSVFRYKGKDVTPQTVGADLKVQAILNGRIVMRGDVLMLSLELADARTENVIWSEHYSRKQTDLISLQSEIVRDVLNNLRVKLAGADERKLEKNYTTSAEAYQLYLKGRLYWNRRTLKDLERALGYFNQAIAIDPNYAMAYAGLADTYVVLPFYRNEMVREAMSRAREAAMKALSLDGDLAEARATLGFVNTHEYNFAGAEREYRRAIELNPNYATAHQWYGEMLSHLARHEEAFAELRRALEIDPLALIINVWYGNSLFYARRYDDAIAQLKKTLELDAGFAKTHQSLANIYQAKGNYAEAVEEFAKYQELTGEQHTAAQIRESFARGGWQGFLRAMTLEQRLPNLLEYEKVVFLAALGEKEKAFAKPDESYEVFGCVLKVDPLLDPLRDDPRFAELLRRVGLPPE
jgi:Predicted integral membrane protein